MDGADRAGAPSFAASERGLTSRSSRVRSKRPQACRHTASDDFRAGEHVSIDSRIGAPHLLLQVSGPVSVISTNWPRLSILHSRRTARPSSTTQVDQRRRRILSATASAFPSSTGRSWPAGARDNCDKVGVPGESGPSTNPCSTAFSTRLWTPHQARSRQQLLHTMACVSWWGEAHTVRVTLAHFMHMHQCLTAYANAFNHAWPISRTQGEAPVKTLFMRRDHFPPTSWKPAFFTIWSRSTCAPKSCRKR